MAFIINTKASISLTNFDNLDKRISETVFTYTPISAWLEWFMVLQKKTYNRARLRRLNTNGENEASRKQGAGIGTEANRYNISHQVLPICQTEQHLWSLKATYVINGPVLHPGNPPEVPSRLHLTHETLYIPGSSSISSWPFPWTFNPCPFPVC